MTRGAFRLRVMKLAFGSGRDSNCNLIVDLGIDPLSDVIHCRFLSHTPVRTYNNPLIL